LLDDLRRRERERDIVDPLVAALHRSLDPAEVAGATFREVLKRLGFTRGLLALTDPQGTFVPFAHEGISETLITAVSGLSVHEGLGAFFAKTHQPLAVGLDEYPPYLPLRAQWELEGFRAVAFLPLPADDGLVGLLILGTEKPLAEDDDRGWLLELIAGHVAHAVTNARRHAVLAASEELHRSSVEGLQDAVYRLTPAGALAYLSPRIEELTGYRAEEFFRTADFWRSVVHPDDRTEYSLRVSGHADGSAGRELHYRMLPRGRAEYRHVRDAVRYLRAGDGTLTGLVGVLSVVAPAPRTEVEHPGELVFDGIADGVAVFDPSATCIVWNAAAAALTGIDRARALGNPPPAPEGLEELDAAVRSALAGEIVAPLSWQAQADRPGSGRVTCTAVRGPSGAVTAVVVTFHGEGRGEQDPHAPEETLRRIVNAMGDALVISDLEGRVWEVSGEFTRMTGYTRQEVLGVAFPYPWIPDEEMGTYVHWVAALRERQSLHDFDSVWRARDGRPVAVSITTTMLRTALGEPMAMVNVARDIGERKRLAQEMALLSDLGRDLGGVVDGPGVLAVVLDGLRTAVGAESAALFRKSGREWMSETVVPASSAVPLDAEVIALLRRAEETGKGSVGGGDENTLLAIPLRMKQGRGETLFVRIAGGRRDARPELRLAQNIATLTSISLDRALLYDETLAKSQEIARRNKELDDFAYVVSHDLKEPLITIEGYAKILIEECAGALPVEAGEYLQTVRRSGQRMQRLIDDLLTLSRVGRGEESLSAVDSSRVVDEVLAEMSFTLRERGATVERPETLPVVRTNRTHLLMVFRNLIANAVKFTTGDNPRVAVTAREGDGEVVFGVADNGIGIAPEHHERIFEIFRRLHPEGEFPGTGAGLTIVRRIVERHHGRIWVESALGAGSTFFFTVPKETAQS
jgi:PAS domain S-box-containing protein